MIMFWPLLFSSGSTTCDYPAENKVVYGTEFDFGDKVGTYIPNMQTTNPSFTRVPNVQTAMLGWLQPMLFELITKNQDDYQVVETAERIGFKGVWQPFTTQQLLLKPEGQRAWKWFTCHSEVMLELSPDDIIRYEDEDYRVMEKLDFSKNGYYEYHLVQDFTGSEPT